MKLAALLVALLLTTLALASITLTNPFVVTVGGTQTENDTAAGLMVYSVNAGIGGSAPSLDAYFHQGTVSGQAINKGANAPVVELSVNLVTGAWVGSNGTSGTLTGPQLTSVVSTLKANRNALETFAVNNGVIAGAQVAW